MGFGVVAFAELVLTKSLGLFCAVIVMFGVKTDPIGEASITPRL